jgi:4-methyl-5(b-hydroxyethyl)-thiazole monophosphate biosynthesis
LHERDKICGHSSIKDLNQKRDKSIMSKALVLMAEGFEEIELVTIVDVLRRGGVGTHLASINGTKGAHGLKIESDFSIDELKEPYEAIILPGGIPGAENLGKSKKVLDLIKEGEREGRLVGAICAAPSILARLGIIEKGTIYPSMKDELGGAWVDETVVETKNIITSQGPGTAMEFALKLLERLEGKEKAEEVAKSLLFKK